MASDLFVLFFFYKQIVIFKSHNYAFLTFHQGHFNFFNNFVQFLRRIYKSLTFSFGMQKFYAFNFHFKCSNTTRNFSTNYFNLVPWEFWFKLRFDLFEFRLINSSVTSSSTVKKKLVSKLNTPKLPFSESRFSEILCLANKSHLP